MTPENTCLTGRRQLKCDGTRAETRFRLLVKGTSPFKSVGASVQSTTCSRVVRISGSNAGYTMFRGSVKSTGYPLHSPVSPSLPIPCVIVCHHISTGVYLCMDRKLSLYTRHNGRTGWRWRDSFTSRPNYHRRKILDNIQQEATWTRQAILMFWIRQTPLYCARNYRGADKSLARPGRKQARMHVRDARDFNNIETRAVTKFFFPARQGDEGNHAILTEILASFVPGRVKDLSAPLY